MLPLWLFVWNLLLLFVISHFTIGLLLSCLLRMCCLQNFINTMKLCLWACKKKQIIEKYHVLRKLRSLKKQNEKEKKCTEFLWIYSPEPNNSLATQMPMLDATGCEMWIEQHLTSNLFSLFAKVQSEKVVHYTWIKWRRLKRKNKRKKYEMTDWAVKFSFCYLSSITYLRFHIALNVCIL